MALLNITTFFTALVLHITYRLFTDPLRKYPGPWLASWTDLWRVWDAVSGWHRPPSLVPLHKRHGNIVRIGPSTLSFASPQAIKDIYGTDKPFGKSGYYYVAAASARGSVTPSLFSSRDVAWHDNLRRAVNPAFSLSSLVQYEPYVSSAVEELLHQLGARYADKSGRDGLVLLHRWLHFYAYDIIGEITYGAPFGFVKSGSDVEDMIAVTRKFLVYANNAGVMPILDKLWIKNPILLWLNRNGLFNSKPNPAVPWALKNQAAALKNPPPAGEKVPLILKFNHAKSTHPEAVTDKEVLGMGISMVFAGSESTAVTLTAIFYFLLKNSEAYRRLQAEVDAAFQDEEQAVVPFRVAFQLPYLDAVVKESFRLHPAARFSYERVLPPAGAVIEGEQIPGGTTVGVNAWAIHRRPEIYGSDVETFRPERWLDADKEKVRIMERTLMHFGAGKFVCIGKNISLLEIYKVVPSLMKRFKFELDDPEKERRFEKGSFVNVSFDNVRIKTRRSR